MKYRQRGYQDDEQREQQPRPERPPRRDPDLPGGRLSAPQRAIRVLRCHVCGHALPLEQDVRGDILPVPIDATCPNCTAAVHACRNCVHFDPRRHLECRKPIKVGFRKDAANDCQYFEPKVTVEMTRDEARPENAFATAQANQQTPRTRNDARKAFDDLFKR